jgi:hypothetical protein
MDLQTFLRRHPLAGEVPPDALLRVEALLDQGVPVLELLRRPEIELPARTVRALTAAHARLQAWRRASERLHGRVPEALLERAVEPHQLAALERAMPLLPPDRWGTALDLWDRCLALARRDGGVTAQGAPGKGFDEYLRRREPLDGLAPHRWLRVRRGERERALILRFDLPDRAFEEQAAVLELPPALLTLLVNRPLEPALRDLLDRWAEEEAIQAARTLYVGLLTAPALETAPVLAVAPGRQSGAAVLDARGELVAGGVVAGVNEAAALADRHPGAGDGTAARGPAGARPQPNGGPGQSRGPGRSA